MKRTQKYHKSKRYDYLHLSQRDIKLLSRGTALQSGTITVLKQREEETC